MQGGVAGNGFTTWPLEDEDRVADPDLVPVNQNPLPNGYAADKGVVVRAVNEGTYFGTACNQLGNNEARNVPRCACHENWFVTHRMNVSSKSEIAKIVSDRALRFPRFPAKVAR